MVKKKQYTFIDLFAGCGGLSEGFMESGHFRGLAHVEWELPMVQTLRNRLVKMKKIIGEYKRFENLENYHAPEFNSNASEFHVTLWNLNYGMDVIKDNPHVVKATEDVIKDVVKETGDVVKAKANVTKEFVKAQRQIYKLISQTPQINATQMSENMGISLRQVQRYLKQLSDLNLIVREGGRKNGIWKILDEEYEGFFKRI